MTLVERFIEIDGGPTYRKVAWVSVAGGLGAIAMVPPTHVAATRSGVVDVSLNDRFYLFFAAAFVVVGVLTRLPARRGTDGRWTMVLIVLSYGAAAGYLNYQLGIWSTPFAAGYALYPLFVALLFGVRAGVFATCYALGLVCVIGVLQTLDVLDYAPGLNDGRVAAQDSVAWAICILVPLLLTFTITVAISLLTIAARRLQDEHLAEANAQLERSGQLIRRFVPSQLADQIIAGTDVEEFRPARTKLTVFFSDLVGFTDVSEELEPEDLARVLNEYFSEMLAIAHRHGGTVDEISGDAILVFFGAPVATSDRDHALRAVRMAVEMQVAVSRLNDAWRKAGITESLAVRMGINTGVVTIGNFGSTDRMKYAVLGKHVNLAARIQTTCEPGKVLISHATWLLVNEEIDCVPKGEGQFKGITRPVATYEVSG
ncbi:adenylate/guanylate cyclase domain-containing protein [Nocardioides marmorisolisilvae]|uniref:adenylate/guanylate cyclase domain-containing protein n=1 Tax=Nocardioides marmorisolisilvae TaxID=1542737 RepID=UPI001614525D|nr:adenylate/guanylate cyclase domain-containing protein [Nocardioides marmorisolisilvae]